MQMMSLFATCLPLNPDHLSLVRRATTLYSLSYPRVCFYQTYLRSLFDLIRTEIFVFGQNRASLVNEA